MIDLNDLNKWDGNFWEFGWNHIHNDGMYCWSGLERRLDGPSMVHTIGYEHYERWVEFHPTLGGHFLHVAIDAAGNVWQPRYRGEQFVKEWSL